ncbi:hypothetical protein M082_0680 [Bacteroides fragilis str. 3725 D9 ii]|nr:hypothetical protein M082_0680 [Bacteroides fragilis str. 3725 D9 ii]
MLSENIGGKFTCADKLVTHNDQNNENIYNLFIPKYTFINLQNIYYKNE